MPRAKFADNTRQRRSACITTNVACSHPTEHCIDLCFRMGTWNEARDMQRGLLGKAAGPHLDAHVENEGVHERGVVASACPCHVTRRQQKAAGQCCNPGGGRPVAEVAVNLHPAVHHEPHLKRFGRCHPARILPTPACKHAKTETTPVFMMTQMVRCRAIRHRGASPTQHQWCEMSAESPRPRSIRWTTFETQDAGALQCWCALQQHIRRGAEARGALNLWQQVHLWPHHIPGLIFSLLVLRFQNPKSIVCPVCSSFRGILSRVPAATHLQLVNHGCLSCSGLCRNSRMDIGSWPSPPGQAQNNTPREAAVAKEEVRTG